MKSRSISQLVRRGAAGDAEALRELHRAVMPAMIAFFRRANGVSPAAAEELANQSLAEAFQALTTGRYDAHRASFTTFLHGVAYKIRLRHVRSRVGTHEVAFSELAGDRSDLLPEKAAEETEHEIPLDEVLAMRACLFGQGGSFELSPEERFVIIGRANGATFQALADQLGRSLDTVYRLNLRATDKLRERMKSKGYYDGQPKNK